MHLQYLLLDLHERASGPLAIAFSFSCKDLLEATFLPPLEAELSVVVVSLLRAGEPFSLEADPLCFDGAAAAREALGSNRHVKASRPRNFIMSILVGFVEGYS
jgi:hypothetical protein